MANDYIPEILKFIRDMTLEKKNPLGLSGDDCSKWAKDLGIPRGGDTVIYTSCMYQIMGYGEALTEFLTKLMGDPTTSIPIKFSRLSMKLKINPVKVLSAFGRNKRFESVLLKAVKILQRIGIEFGYLYEEEPYSGTLLYEYGFHDDFADYARYVYSFLRSKGVKKIIVFDPHTADLFKTVYPEFVDGFDLEVELFIDILKEAISEGKIRLKASNGEKVTFHDPCHYAKYLGIVEEPRSIIRSIKNIELIDHARSGELSVCCGGPIESLYPKLSKFMARNRVEELLETGARKIIVACPICMANFERAKGLVKEKYEVEDLVELVYRYMEE